MIDDNLQNIHSQFSFCLDIFNLFIFSTLLWFPFCYLIERQLYNRTFNKIYLRENAITLNKLYFPKTMFEWLLIFTCLYLCFIYFYAYINCVYVCVIVASYVLWMRCQSNSKCSATSSLLANFTLTLIF